MSFRIVMVSKSCKLDLSLNAIIIRDHRLRKIHINEIAILIIESLMVSMSSALLVALIEAKVKVIFCDGRHLPVSELVPYYGGHATSARLLAQMGISIEAKQTLWQEIVRDKIQKQQNLLATLGLDTPATLLASYVDEVLLNDASNREAHAAKVYFNALFGKDFSRDKDCNINAALNYGYSLLLASFSREIVASGYDTRLGIFHKNQFNHFNLACDLMESFRPLIDKEVVALHKKGALALFDKDVRRALIAVLNSDVKIDGKTQKLLNAISIYTKSVFSALVPKEGKKRSSSDGKGLHDESRERPSMSVARYSPLA